MSKTNPVEVLRITALVEAVSFLILLAIAMPLKYFAGLPAAVKVTGWIHGILFMIFCVALIRVMAVAKWPPGRGALVFAAALVPFGPFVLDRRMKQYREEFRRQRLPEADAPVGDPSGTLILMLCAGAILAINATRTGADELGPLAVGVAGHAFDHLGGIGDQASAAAASGSNIIYATGLGGLGYGGLPAPQQLKVTAATTADYLRDAKAAGIRIAFGYVCATSIVKLETFDRHWPPDLRRQFSSAPANWLQLDREGKSLPSWYGGDYRPACMNHPDWRSYQKFIVRLQLESGHDGIFFDNPTVHPQGCYCEHCMKAFGKFLKIEPPTRDPVEVLRQVATRRQRDFMRFRCTIAADFLAEVKAYARTIKPDALITCNNSLNAPESFYSQCRTYAYNIHELSKVEDLIVVEDMATQPRVLDDGTPIEYGPVYALLHSISHGKPLVVSTIAQADYHTAPNLMRLAMAEAAAHGASYLSWPTWPEKVRQKMIEAVRPQADFLRKHAGLLNGAKPCADAYLLLPFRRWVETPDCHVLKTARTLSAANLQFHVICEDDVESSLPAHPPSTVIAESSSVLGEPQRRILEKFESAGGRIVWSGQTNWLADLRQTIVAPAVAVTGPPTIRAIVRHKSPSTIVHVLNLNVQRISSFEDRVNPVSQLRLRIRCFSKAPKTIKALSADVDATQGEIPFNVQREKDATIIEVTLSRVVISTILLIE